MRAYGGESEKGRREEEEGRRKKRRRRKKEEEKKKKIQVWKFGIHVWKLILVSLELWFGTSLLFGTLVFVSMKPICMVLLVRKKS